VVRLLFLFGTGTGCIAGCQSRRIAYRVASLSARKALVSQVVRRGRFCSGRHTCEMLTLSYKYAKHGSGCAG
jgi:hypothetical protein